LEEMKPMIIARVESLISVIAKNGEHSARKCIGPGGQEV
jgi:hypothetical protein